MYYEFYLDVYFLENLVLNCLVICLAGRLQKERASLLRIVLSGMAGAFLACLEVLLPIHKSTVLTALCGLAACPLMAVAAFGTGRGAGRLLPVRMTMCIAGLALALGAVWQFLRAELSVPFAAAVPAGYFLARLFCGIWHRVRCRTNYIYEVTLERGDKKVCLTGFLDSGNRLVQPGTLRPVHIVDFAQIRELLTEEETRELAGLLRMQAEGRASGKFTYIPFHSIGDGQGVLPAMTLDGMCIKHGESAWRTKGVLVAVSGTAVSGRGEYQIILHPRILA